MPAPVTAVLAVQGDLDALLRYVLELVEAWPVDVEGELVVATRVLDGAESELLATMSGALRVVSTADPVASLGALVIEAALTLAARTAVLVLDTAVPVTTEGLREMMHNPWCAGDLAAHPVLRVATDPRALRALLTHPGEPVGAPPALGGGPSRPGGCSAVVLAQGGLAGLRACLDSLRRGGPRSLEVVVVDNGATLAVTTFLASRPDLVVVRNPRALSVAAARNQGLVRATGECVLMLDEQTLLPRDWALGLRRGVGVVAVGPVAFGLAGTQHAPEARYDDQADLTRCAAGRRREHGATTVPVEALAGAPLLLDRDTALEVGGYHPGLAPELVGQELCDRLLTRGGLAVATGVLAHVDPAAEAGSWPRTSRTPQLSAALIVRDEQDALPACLASLRGVVDEVVVCDTGSTDATVEVARWFGATVVHHAWDDDFSDARNAALAATSGTWVLSIDADEQLEVDDVRATRSLLTRSADHALRLPIRSRSQPEDLTGYQHEAARLLRRGAVEWVGAVHEVPARIGDAAWLDTPPLPGVRLEHDGYLEHVRTSRGKSARNLQLAEKDLAATPLGDARRWKAAYELARTLGVSELTAARVIELTQECLSLRPPAHFRCGALVLLSGALLSQGRSTQAVAAAHEARAANPDSAAATLALATVLEASGDTARARAAVEAWTPRGRDPERESRLAQLLVPAQPGPEQPGPEQPFAETLGQMQRAVEDGDHARAALLMEAIGPLPPQLAAEAVELTRLLGLLEVLPGQVKQGAISR